MVKSGKMADMSVKDAQKNYKKAIEKGVLKILSKMGISLLSCYHGAQIFEIYGLGEEVVEAAFRGSVSRIGGLSIDDLQREAESFWMKVCSPAADPGLCRTFTLHDCNEVQLHKNSLQYVKCRSDNLSFFEKSEDGLP